MAKKNVKLTVLQKPVYTFRIYTMEIDPLQLTDVRKDTLKLENLLVGMNERLGLQASPETLKYTYDELLTSQVYFKMN